MDTELITYHLKGKGFCGRGVRLRELLPSECAENLAAAAKLVNKDATMIELKTAEYRLGIRSMVVEVSDPVDDLNADGVKWRKVTAETLQDLGDFFRAKDVEILEIVFKRMHEISQAELDAITGEARPVSAA